MKLSPSTLALIAPFALWGTAMVFMKGVIPHTTPLFLAGIRLLPAGILVVAVALLMGRPQPQGWRAWLWISLFALVDGTLFQGFLAQGLVRTGAGLGSVMIDSQPLAVALLALWIFGEQIGLWGWVGLALGGVGISFIGLPDAWILSWGQKLQAAMLHSLATVVSWVPTLNPAPLDGPALLPQLFQSGEWLMLLAALSMAVGTILLRVICRYADPVSATGWHMILGGLPLLVASAGVESEQWINLNAMDWLALGYATVFGSAIAYGLFFYFAASGSLTSLSSLTFLTPVFALCFGNLLLAEVLTPIQWLGVCCTLISIYLINQREKLTMSWRRSAQVSQLLLKPTAVPVIKLHHSDLSRPEGVTKPIISVAITVPDSDAEVSS
ncbi:membrane protein [Neosynechococcus sphagnicola sy1]|uniref:Membrane protein n=1 Tax=Neosynechococcus sphagnicola sy1 TaxID=1497020 RepID=A0A098TND1_9CYAN|nr:membrane protein [Neosynechococcus sphagnicola sy1]